MPLQSWPLPPELTKDVLRALPGKAGDYCDLCSAALVCKEWKVGPYDDSLTIHVLNDDVQSISSALMWGTVIIKSQDGLTAFLRSLMDCTYLFGRSPGLMVREFELAAGIQLAAGTSINEAAMVTVLMQLPHLQRYEMRIHTATIATFVCLSKMCGDTLTSLTIKIHASLHGAFPVINSLTKLKTLNLSFQSGPWGHLSGPPLRLKSLASLFWFAAQADDDMIIFLSRCTLRPRCMVQLKLDSSDVRTELLRPFFQTNTVDMLKLSMPGRCLVLIAPEILRARSVVFYEHMPPPALLDNALTCPSTLGLRFPTFLPQEQLAFWEFLDRLTTFQVPAPTKEITVLLYYLPNQQFDWVGNIDERYTLFIGRLLRVAIILFRRRIMVKDFRGRDVTSLTRV
jgi:hypothetical protein